MVQVLTDWDDFSQYFDGRVPEAALKASVCPLGVCAPTWAMGHQGVYRPDGQYYRGEGVFAEQARNREVISWRQFMITNDSGNKVALVVDFQTGHILVRMKAEPGNIGPKLPDGTNSRVNIAPTAQFTLSNLERHRAALRGESDPTGEPFKLVPFASLLDGSAISNAAWEAVPGDGGRFFEKRDEIGVLFYENKTVPDLEVERYPEAPDFAWVTREILEKARGRKLLSHYSFLALSVLDYVNRNGYGPQ